MLYSDRPTTFVQPCKGRPTIGTTERTTERQNEKLEREPESTAAGPVFTCQSCIDSSVRELRQMARRRLVQKYGGTSLGSAERLHRVAEIVRYARFHCSRRAQRPSSNTHVRAPNGGTHPARRRTPATTCASCSPRSARRPRASARRPGPCGACPSAGCMHRRGALDRPQWDP